MNDPVSRFRRAVSLARNLALVVAAVIVASYVGRPTAPVDPGFAAPTTVGIGIDGARFDLGALRGTPTIVNVWATWCPPCRAELPALGVTARQLAGRVAFVGLAVQSPADEVASLARQFALPYPVVRIDGHTQAAWGATAVPSTYLLDECQRVVWSIEGSVDEHVLAEAVASYLDADPSC